jgi:DNA-binding Lrp family transcriptional regulator
MSEDFLPLDDTDRRLVVALSRDGRQSAAALAQALGLSRQAVGERIRALERRGVIRGYHAAIDPRALGLGVAAEIRLSLTAAQAPGDEERLLERLGRHTLVRQVLRLSGEDCFAVRLQCRDIADVTTLFADLRETGVALSSRTSFVLESIVDRAPFGPVDAPSEEGP